MSIEIRARIDRKEWRWTITNVTPERFREAPNTYRVERTVHGPNAAESGDAARKTTHIEHTPTDGIDALVRTTLTALPMETEEQRAARRYTEFWNTARQIAAEADKLPEWKKNGGA